MRSYHADKFFIVSSVNSLSYIGAARLDDEPVVYYKNGTVKVYGKIYSKKRDHTCPKVTKDSFFNLIKAPLKHIIMRPLRHPQRYEAAWVLTKDHKSLPPICLTWYIDTMRFFIQDGVHRCHVAYDMGYDYVPAFIMLEDKEPEHRKKQKTFEGQPRNLFERMRLPAKIVPETCAHRAKWQVDGNGGYSGPLVCRWCEFKYNCFKELVGGDAREFDSASDDS